MGSWLITLVGAFLCTLALTWLIRKYALRVDLVDLPNVRSSHACPMPSGGGIAIVFGWLCAVMALLFSSYVDFHFLSAIVLPAIAVAGLGFLDDRRELSRSLRFGVQITVVIWFLFFLERPLFVGIPWLDNLPIMSYATSGFALVWLINLFNFMDGIDGIAGSEAIFISLGIVIILIFLGESSPFVLVNIAIAGACLGFLVWNWPPAKIFMGDVGSSSIGFILGAITLAVSSESAISIWPWLILFGVFLVDATVTLVRRGFSGQRWYEAHHSHAYQRLARQWGSHRKVTLSVIGINVCWLLPMALWAAIEPGYAIAIAGLALLPLTGLAFWIGAGRPEPS